MYLFTHTHTHTQYVCTARPQQRCPTVFRRALAGRYTIEVTIRLDEREHAHEYICITMCIYMKLYVDISACDIEA